MIDAAASLERAGADFIVLCTNTMHKLAGDIQANIRIPLLVHEADCRVPLFPTTTIHALAAVEYALA